MEELAQLMNDLFPIHAEEQKKMKLIEIQEKQMVQVPNSHANYYSPRFYYNKIKGYCTIL